MKSVAIFGPPRSGTSWLSQIWNSHPDVAVRFQPLFSHGHKGALSEFSSREQIDRFLQALAVSDDPFVLMKSIFHKDYPSFYKSPCASHLVFKENRYLQIIENLLKNSDIFVVGIIRNPLATLASWFEAPKEFSPEWDLRDEWRLAQKKNGGRPEEYYGFDRWKEAANNFIRFQVMYSERFRLVRYAALNRDPHVEASALFDGVGLSMHSQVVEFINRSRSTKGDGAYSVYRLASEDDRWRHVLPVDIVEAVISDLAASPLAEFLSG